MLFGPISFVLLSSFLCLCRGGRPQKGEQPYNVGAAYTSQEDKFIYNALVKLPHGYTPARGHNIWSELANEHNALRLQRTAGFPQKRSAESLYSRYRDVLMKDFSSEQVNTLESLMQGLSINSNGNIQRRTGNTNGESSSQNQQAQRANGDDSIAIAELVEELQNSNYDVDFTLLQD